MILLFSQMSDLRITFVRASGEQYCYVLDDGVVALNPFGLLDLWIDQYELMKPLSRGNLVVNVDSRLVVLEDVNLDI